MRNWGKLVERYANGRKICNCGKAYYTWDEKQKCYVCEHGCSANFLEAVDYVSKQVLEDLARLDDLFY